MPFDSERDALIFDLRMALLSFRIGPPNERSDSIRRIQAAHIIAHLERCGWQIEKVQRDTGQKPSNIGE